MAEPSRWLYRLLDSDAVQPAATAATGQATGDRAEEGCAAAATANAYTTGNGDLDGSAHGDLAAHRRANRDGTSGGVRATQLRAIRDAKRRGLARYLAATLIDDGGVVPRRDPRCACACGPDAVVEGEDAPGIGGKRSGGE